MARKQKEAVPIKDVSREVSEALTVVAGKYKEINVLLKKCCSMEVIAKIKGPYRDSGDPIGNCAVPDEQGVDFTVGNVQTVIQNHMECDSRELYCYK